MLKSILNRSFLLLLTLFIAGMSVPARHVVAKDGLELKIFFTNPNLPDYANDCGAGEFVKRKVPSTKQVANAALKLVFAGPSAEEKAKGMQSVAPLGDYYLGVKIKNGVATVNFRRGAEKYLFVSGPICMQDTALAPISVTLKQFASVKSVDYAIEGKIIEDWDA